MVTTINMKSPWKTLENQAKHNTCKKKSVQIVMNNISRKEGIGFSQPKAFGLYSGKVGRFLALLKEA